MPRDTGLICDGRPKYTYIDRTLSEIVEDNSILCTDKHRSYIPFAAQHNFELHQIRGGRKTVDIYNIQELILFMERIKPKKFFVHANSTHSISLIKDFKIRRPIYV